jgi:hypothetical protein
MPVSLNQVRATVTNTCQICQESGTTGSKIKRTFAYCSCAAGIELHNQKGPDWPTNEIERCTEVSKPS